MQNSPVPSNDDTSMPAPTTSTPPPPPVPHAVNLTPFPPPSHQQLQYPPRAPYQQAPAQHRSVTVQMSPRNLILGGSVIAFVIVVIVAFALLSGNSSRPTPNIYSNGSFPGSSNPGSSNPGFTTTTDSNGNSVTMGPGAHAVQNPDGSTTTTDANGNTVTQGGGGNSVNSGNGGDGGFSSPQQSPFQGDSSFPQQQQNYPQQQGQQQDGYNPQQAYPQQPR